MTRPPDPPHLSEERLVAEARRITPHRDPHLEQCELCRARLALARELLRLDGLAVTPGDRQRRSRLVRRLEAARAADNRPARLRVRHPHDGGLVLEARHAEVFTRAPALALRSAAEPVATPLGCRRRFGDYEVAIEITASPGTRSGEVDVDVSLLSPATERASATLLANGRELSVKPLGRGRTTFRQVTPGLYTIDVSDRRVVVGRLLVDLGEERA